MLKYENEKIFSKIKAIEDFRKLPLFSALFFIKYIDGFRFQFIIFTIIGIVSNLLKFYTIYLLGDAISNIDALTLSALFLKYIPTWLFVMVFYEYLDSITRKYTEQLPQRFCDYANFLFYLRILELKPDVVNNISKERVSVLINRYVQNLRRFLNDCVWGLNSKITQLCVVLIVYT